MSAMSTATSVKVGVRIRPLLPKEKHQAESLRACGPQSIQLKEQTYSFDHVFSSGLSQHALYTKTAAPMLKSFLEGYNVTIMAYGQTGSGKTHTMGTSDLASVEDPELQGLIPRFVNDLFENLKSNSFNGGETRPSARVKVSFLEIYGEDIYDLITSSTCAALSSHRPANGSGDRPSLLVREDEAGRVFVQGQHEVEVSSAQTALDLLCIGSRNRITGSTAMNAGSSRSHAVYTVTLEQSLPSDGATACQLGDDQQQMSSKLTFVDLAGSERLKRTGAEGQRLKEGIQINSGLFNLGQVINALADDVRIKSGAKAAFVPYRNSKLTHLLKDALGGNSQTLFLACVSPAESNESESQSTLQYARQARNIQNKPVKNMDRQQLELRRLKYSMQAWMLKAVSMAFDGRAELSGGVQSPLPCVSPARGSTSAGPELLLRPEVQDYISQVTLQIEERLRDSAPTPLLHRVRLSVLPSFHSPMRGLAQPPPKPNADVDTDESFRGGHLADALFSEGSLRLRSGHRDSVLASMKGRDSVFEAQDPEETERLVARMIEMVSKEKGEAQEVEGESAMGVIDEEIEEKEQILTKLLDTVKSYSVMKSDFERLLGAIEELEVERAQLGAALERAKTASNSSAPGAAAVEKIKERFARVQGELKQMKEERKDKENAYKLMQRESKQLEALQQELAKLKESKVSLLRAQKQQQSSLSLAKKEAVSKIASLKKIEVKKQRQVNTLKSELVKKERVLGHKDREIGRMASKLRACEDHITQLLKIQNRNRQRVVASGTTSSASAISISLSDGERAHFESSKAVLESIIAERVERRCVLALYDKKSAALDELNKELLAEMQYLDRLVQERRQLLNGQPEEAFEELLDGAVPNRQHAEYLAVKEGVSNVESSIDRISRELDFYNADLDDLAGRIEAADEGTKGDAMSKEIISSLSAPQLQLFLVELVGDKVDASVRASQQSEQVKQLTERYEGAKEQLAEQESLNEALKIDLRERLEAAEKRRVEEMWSLLRAQSAAPGSSAEESGEGSSLQLRIAIQRAGDLEREVEGGLAAEETLRMECAALQEQVATLRGELGGKEMLAELASEHPGSVEAQECLRSLAAAWDVLGVPQQRRREIVRAVTESSQSARSCAVEDARSQLQKATADIECCNCDLRLLAQALGRETSHYLDSGEAAAQELLLPRLTLYEAAASRAADDVAARVSAASALREHLLDLVAEMWLEAPSLPVCLQVLTKLPVAECGSRAECGAVAQQLLELGLQLDDAALRAWEAEIKKLNVARAAITTQLISARAGVSGLLRSLDLFNAQAALRILSGHNDAAATPSQSAALSLVLAATAANPPGSQQILDAMERLRVVFQGVRASRSAVYRVLLRLHEACAGVCGEPLPVAGCEHNYDELGALLTSSLGMQAQLIILRDQRRATLTALLHSAKVDLCDEKIASLLSGSPPAAASSVLARVEDCYEELRSAAEPAEDWVSANCRAILDNHALKGGGGLLRDALLLGEEVARFTQVAELLAELAKHDSAMSKMVAEMEDFEISSKNNRSALLSGNSKALVEEERFRKNGKKRYEALSEKIVSATMQLQALAAGGALPVSVDLAFLAPCSASLLRCKSYSDRVELMHLHTMTHDAHRRSVEECGGDAERESSAGSHRCDNNENITDSNGRTLPDPPRIASKTSKLPTSKASAVRVAESTGAVKKVARK